MEIIKVNDLWKSFKIGFIPHETTVLKGISFTVKEARITGFIGANGAGKTTVLKCILGTIFPSKGSISFFGGETLSARVKSQIGFLPEHPYFYDFLTGYEFLNFHMRLLPLAGADNPKRVIEETLARVGLAKARDKKLRSFSKGMLQRIGIAQAILHKPKLLLLDEPMSGLDPDGRFEVTKIIQEVAAEGTTIFFSSHLLHDAQRLCHDLVVLKEGVQVYNGPIEGLLGAGETKYHVHYQSGGKETRVTVASLSDVQARLAELMRAGAVIKEVQPERADLETVFQRSFRNEH